MITNELLEFINDEDVTKEKKLRYLDNLNLQHSDLCLLAELCKGEQSYNLIYPYLFLQTNKVYVDIEKQNRKYSNANKNKKIRRITKKYKRYEGGNND